MRLSFFQKRPHFSVVPLAPTSPSPLAWGGPIGFAIDFLPLLGRGGRHGNILHAIAYAGHGVALASYAGRLVADLLLGRDSPGAALWTRRRIPLPPEPFRWLIVRALTGVFGVMDQRAERVN
jgi:gamma-glutamylputrescine oxidase